MKSTVRALATIAAALALSACGFTGNLRMNPGFASFRTPSTVPGTDRTFALSLGPVPLRLATMISRPLLADDEPWIPETLAAVRAVRVYAYEVGDDYRAYLQLEETRDDLVDDGWEPIAVVREDGGLVAALVMPREDEAIRGLVVIVQEDEELVLVNVIGNMTPETFNVLMEGLDIELPIIEIVEA